MEIGEASLWERHPLPWRVEAIGLARDQYGGYIVYDAQDQVVLNGGTYTGDGDEVQDLYWHEVIELVEWVNQRKV